MKGQTSTEFVILTTFMLLVFLVFLILIQTKMSEGIVEKNNILAQSILDKVIYEIRLAEAVSDGYEKQFILPSFLENGIAYNLIIIGYPGGGELVIRYENTEKVYFLDTQINSSSNIGIGRNIIKKNNGIVEIQKI
ncbi:MAG: hypothetical protein KatS3mg002_1449 [Candidatus Woesearchaeota archaeon]|nr:MAG: hypothetical protein KatS3mg002_1449 [Candidatus Woesearchaeota archaeon]